MFIDFQGKQIYAEVHGAGEPLVLLNGIMMSTLSWAALVPSLAKFNQVILLDMLDQGQSSKMTETYDISLQADVVKCVLDALGHKKAHIMGASYGAAVAMNFAIQYPDCVDKFILANCVAYASTWLREIGEAWKAARITPETYYYATIPVIYSMDFFGRKADWMAARKKLLCETAFANPVFLDAIERLSSSMYTHDVRDRLHEIKAKTILIGSREDYLTPINEQRYIYDRLEHADFVVMEDCGHAAMYERPEVFVGIMIGFLHTDPIIIP
ncbi:MAG: alpha/beta hydrolase [Oscillospiraceae bacterium]|nr:alpha/beta hydrolase [Oscillospiraceae bacterium]